MVAAQTELYGDTGAYASLGEKVMTRATTHSSGPYEIPNVRADCYAIVITSYSIHYTKLYEVDGHNLIPKVGLRLDSFDDEMELVALLQEFARLHRRQVEVYFDGAPAGTGLPADPDSRTHALGRGRRGAHQAY